jgi:hypothetical protein
MACACGEKLHRVFPASNNFAVYFDAKRKTFPVSWRSEELAVCLSCIRHDGVRKREQTE